LKYYSLDNLRANLNGSEGQYEVTINIKWNWKECDFIKYFVFNVYAKKETIDKTHQKTVKIDTKAGRCIISKSVVGGQTELGDSNTSSARKKNKFKQL